MKIETLISVRQTVQRLRKILEAITDYERLKEGGSGKQDPRDLQKKSTGDGRHLVQGPKPAGLRFKISRPPTPRIPGAPGSGGQLSWTAKRRYGTRIYSPPKGWTPVATAAQRDTTLTDAVGNRGTQKYLETAREASGARTRKETAFPE